MLLFLLTLLLTNNEVEGRRRRVLTEEAGAACVNTEGRSLNVIEGTMDCVKLCDCGEEVLVYRDLGYLIEPCETGTVLTNESRSPKREYLICTRYRSWLFFSEGTEPVMSAATLFYTFLPGYDLTNYILTTGIQTFMPGINGDILYFE